MNGEIKKDDSDRQFISFSYKNRNLRKKFASWTFVPAVLQDKNALLNWTVQGVWDNTGTALNFLSCYSAISVCFDTEKNCPVIIWFLYR